MDKSQFLQFRSWFKNYVSSFYNNDAKIKMNIELKEKHTYRVCENIFLIGKSLNLCEEHLFLAETVGLFHDIGRFEQFKKYQTFQDSKSENHAALGIKVLEKTKALDSLTFKESSIVIDSIKYHNYCNLPGDINIEHVLFCKLIRDADKLDIYKILINYYNERKSNPNIALEIHKDSNAFTQSVLERVLEHRNISYEDINTQNDFRLVQLGWVFDISFPFTLKVIKENGYIEGLIRYLPDTNEIQEVFKHISDFIDKQIVGLT